MTPPADHQIAHWAPIAAVYTAGGLLLYVALGLVEHPATGHSTPLGIAAVAAFGLWLLAPALDGLSRLLHDNYRRIGPAEGLSGWVWDAMCGRTAGGARGLAWLAGPVVVADACSVALSVSARSHPHQVECAVIGGLIWTLVGAAALLVRRRGWQRIAAPVVTSAGPWS